jgi:SM-20-related protein
LQIAFEQIISSYIESRVGVSENLINAQLIHHLRDNLLLMYSREMMIAAGTGSKENVSFSKNLRGDKIFWLDRNNNNVHENKFLEIIDAFIIYLNTSCYTGITGYEFHYTLYETGAFYKKHLDQFRDNNSREFSMIIYLNENWLAGDGGELMIYHQDESIQKINPSGGKSVFFKSSNLAHEVLLTNKPRLSITGWLKRGA